MIRTATLLSVACWLYLSVCFAPCRNTREPHHRPRQQQFVTQGLRGLQVSSFKQWWKTKTLNIKSTGQKLQIGKACFLAQPAHVRFLDAYMTPYPGVQLLHLSWLHNATSPGMFVTYVNSPCWMIEAYMVLMKFQFSDMFCKKRFAQFPCSLRSQCCGVGSNPKKCTVA